MARTSKQNGCATAVISRIKRLLFGLAITVLAPTVSAGELSLIVNGWAKHMDVPAGVKFNERNWGSGFQYDFDRVSEHWVPFVTASGFKDSVYNMSYYAGGGVMRRYDVAPSLDKLYIDIGLVAFAMTRKNFRDNKPFLGALPAATIGTDHLAVNVTYVPRVDPKSVPLWFIQVKVPLTTF